MRMSLLYVNASLRTDGSIALQYAMEDRGPWSCTCLVFLVFSLLIYQHIIGLKIEQRRKTFIPLHFWLWASERQVWRKVLLLVERRVWTSRLFYSTANQRRRWRGWIICKHALCPNPQKNSLPIRAEVEMWSDTVIPLSLSLSLSLSLYLSLLSDWCMIDHMNLMKNIIVTFRKAARWHRTMRMKNWGQEWELWCFRCIDYSCVSSRHLE